MTIKKITPAGHTDVYNLEVEDTHNFVIQGGIISHNCADETRYFCMARPIKPRVAAKQKTVSETVLEQFLDIKPEDITAKPTRQRMVIKK
ncbi:MAG: hypothetical protein IKR26_04515 [Lachnospiraceae bacterium]|nr:hypothetical protein [Lachnospiraceae bacterium]